MQFLVASALFLSWLWPLASLSWFGLFVGLTALLCIAVLASRSGWRRNQWDERVEVSARINHVYPASFGRRVVLKLDCSWRGADGTVREQQHEYIALRKQRDAVMESLYGGTLTLHLDPKDDKVSFLHPEALDAMLGPVLGEQRIAKKSAKSGAPGVDFVPSASSH
jgi:hypothetical protein